jgi:hypothetical protein
MYSSSDVGRMRSARGAVDDSERAAAEIDEASAMWPLKNSGSSSKRLFFWGRAIFFAC